MSRRKRIELADDVIDFLDEATNADYRSMMEVVQTAMTRMALEQQEGHWPLALRDLSYVRTAYDINEDHAWKLKSLNPQTATRH